MNLNGTMDSIGQDPYVYGACCFGKFLANHTGNNTGTIPEIPMILTGVNFISAVALGALLFVSRSNTEELPLNSQQNPISVKKLACEILLGSVYVGTALSTLVLVSLDPACPDWLIPEWNRCQ